MILRQAYSKLTSCCTRKNYSLRSQFSDEQGVRSFGQKANWVLWFILSPEHFPPSGLALSDGLCIVSQSRSILRVESIMCSHNSIFSKPNPALNPTAHPLRGRVPSAPCAPAAG